MNVPDDNLNDKYPLIPKPKICLFRLGTKKIINYSVAEITDSLYGFLQRIRKITSRSQENTNGKLNFELSNLAFNVTFKSLEFSEHIEAYLLKINENGIQIEINAEKGLFYGFQTLLQLLRENSDHFEGKCCFVPFCEIHDWPNFSIRGFMHDVGRNFREIDYLKAQMDIFAQYKINVFHWHLTDNPAWRIESKCFPRLNSAKYTPKSRNPGKFYSYEEIRDFIGYCNERNIQVIPEIDMPGHSKVFRRVFGFSMGSLRGRNTLRKIFEEFLREIPKNLAPIIHLGSDEVHIPFAKSFIKKMSKIIEKSRRKVMVWSPGLQPPENSIIQLWNANKKPKQNLSNIDSRDYYVNNFDPLACIPKIFFRQPCGVNKEIPDKLEGAILCHWPDVALKNQNDSEKFNPVYSALLSFAERLWCGLENCDFVNKITIPTLEEPGYNEFTKFENRLIYHRDRYFLNLRFPYIRQTNLLWKIIGPFPHKGDYFKSFGPEFEIKDSYSLSDFQSSDKSRLKWVDTVGGTINFGRRGNLEGFYKDFENSTAYALTYIYSEKDQKIGFWIGFDLPCRSNRQYRGIPKQGWWDANGGDIWLNNKRLDPPLWKSPESHIYWKKASWHRPIHEIPWEDEEFYWTHSICNIHLRKGWNKILIRIPKSYKKQNWVLNFVPVSKGDKDSLNYQEVQNIQFSQDLKLESEI